MPAAYNQQQSTKPQTLGYALNDSPAGLLAWILEKFRSWSDTRHTQGQLPYTNDFLITNTCLYWLTGNVTSSFRIYYEALHTGDRDSIISKLYCKVGLALSRKPSLFTVEPPLFHNDFLLATEQLRYPGNTFMRCYECGLRVPQLLCSKQQVFVSLWWQDLHLVLPNCRSCEACWQACTQ